MYVCKYARLFPHNTPVVLTHTMLKLQVAVYLRALTIEDLMDPVKSSLMYQKTAAPVYGTFHHGVTAVPHMLTKTMALTAGHAAEV